MNLTSDQARKLYRRFGWGFAISLVILVLSAFAWLFFAADVAALGGTLRVIDLAPFWAIASLFTSFVTFVGFLISNTMAWQKEQRERGQFELEVEKKRLEIEKLHRELAAMQARDAAGDTTPPKHES